MKCLRLSKDSPSSGLWYLNFEKSENWKFWIFREFRWLKFNQVYSIWFNEIRKDLNTYVSEPLNNTLNYLSLTNTSVYSRAKICPGTHLATHSNPFITIQKHSISFNEERIILVPSRSMEHLQSMRFIYCISSSNLEIVSRPIW